jgi:phytoene dehydrogenase-like protein
MTAGRPFGTGYRVPSLAHVQPALPATIVSELGLTRFGYKKGKSLQTIAIGSEAGPLFLSGERAQADGLSAADADAYREFRARYLEFAGLLGKIAASKPPRLRNFSAGDRSLLAQLGWKLRFGLGRDAMYEFLRVAASNIHDLLNEHFEDDRLKGAIAFDAVLGSAMGPRTPGTVLTWLHRLVNERAGGPTSEDTGLVPALCSAAQNSGATIRLSAPVENVLIDNDRAIGVHLASGENIRADRVVAAIDPRKALLELVGPARLDAMFASRVTQIRGTGVVGKLHLGLAGLPAIPGLDPERMGHRLIVAPSSQSVERAFNPSKYGECSREPVFEITLPSVGDASLAPPGHHVMSVNVAYLPYRLKSGWDASRAEVVRFLLRELDRSIPGIEERVTEIDFLSPADIAREYGPVEGHWHHGELSIHQSLMLRPLHGAAQYDTPVTGLYLCSAGCHPGGGISGRPGRNAAHRILSLDNAS